MKNNNDAPQIPSKDEWLTAQGIKPSVLARFGSLDNKNTPGLTNYFKDAADYEPRNPLGPTSPPSRPPMMAARALPTSEETYTITPAPRPVYLQAYKS